MVYVAAPSNLVYPGGVLWDAYPSVPAGLEKGPTRPLRIGLIHILTYFPRFSRGVVHYLFISRQQIITNCFYTILIGGQFSINLTKL